MLPEEIKIKIFSFLSIGSRYNASLVWEEMAEYTWKSVAVDEELIERLENNMATLDDVETAGVLASVGHLDSIQTLFLIRFGFNLSSVPSNIISSLTRVVKDSLCLGDIRGFSSFMLQRIKCKNLHLGVITVPALITEEICVSNCVSLQYLLGDVSGLLDKITCNTLVLNFMDLSNDAAGSLVEMFTSRVAELEICNDFYTTLDTSILTNYDGQGRCEIIRFKTGMGEIREFCFDEDEFRNMWKLENDEKFDLVKDNLVPWANSKGWAVTCDTYDYGPWKWDLEYTFEIRRKK